MFTPENTSLLDRLLCSVACLLSYFKSNHQQNVLFRKRIRGFAPVLCRNAVKYFHKFYFKERKGFEITKQLLYKTIGTSLDTEI